MKYLAFLILILFALTVTKAQNSTNLWSGGLVGGVQQYMGEIGNAWYKTDQAVYGFAGLNVARYFDDRCDIVLQGTAGDIGYNNSTSKLKAFSLHVNVGIRIKFNSKPNLKFVPYFTPGLGFSSLNSYSYGNSSLNTWISPSFAFGLQYKIKPNIALIFEEKALFIKNSQPKKQQENIHNALELQHTIGVLFTLSDVKKVDVNTSVMNELPKITEKTKTVLRNAILTLQFETGTDIIKAESFNRLDDVVKELKENTNLRLAINGYTDNTGEVDKNRLLSQNRADAVKQYLVNKNIDASRLKSTGFGIENPIGDNSTAEGRAKNRRVEFLVL